MSKRHISNRAVRGKTVKATRFNGKFRDECLRMEIFGNWREAVVVAEKWRKFYNSERPHSSLGYQTLGEFRLDWEKRQRLLKNESREKLVSLMAQGLGLDTVTLPLLAERCLSKSRNKRWWRTVARTPGYDYVLAYAFSKVLFLSRQYIDVKICIDKKKDLFNNSADFR